MIESKVIEIRDHGTFIGVLAIRMLGTNPIQSYYLRRCGYPADGSSIMVMMLSDGKATNDPYEWGALRMGPRTLPVAHNYIIDHYDELNDGDVVDVQFILKETAAPKTTERELAAVWAFLARRMAQLPGPVTMLKRGLTHGQAVASALAEMALEVPGELKARYPAHLRRCRDRF